MAPLSKLRPRGFAGAGELIVGSWGALVTILGELGSKQILLEIKGALRKTEEKQFQGFGKIRALFFRITGAQIPPTFDPPFIAKKDKMFGKPRIFVTDKRILQFS